MTIFNVSISERNLSKGVGMSRSTLRKALKLDDSIKISSLKRLAHYFNQTLMVLTHPINHTPESTTVAISFHIMSDGFDSWKIHLMNMVDEFRKTKDARILLLPPDRNCDDKIRTLIAATVLELCLETKMPPPHWAQNHKPLSQPWFVAGVEALKASALLESPLSFRSKNIFVHENFLERA